MVLYGHLSGTRGFPISTASYGDWAGDVAHLGVLIFFVISGFLITSLLINEKERTGSISLKRFYFRRVLRIFPAFYLFVVAVSVAALVGWFHLQGRDYVFALTYTVNYDPHAPWQFGHLWSLSIEEQFYLLWPLGMLVLRKRHACMLAVAAVFVAPMLRAAIREYAFHVDPGTVLAHMSIFPAMFDYLASGCALALLRPWLLTRGWYLRLTASRLLWLLVPLILLINRWEGFTAVMFFGAPAQNLCIVILIEAMTRHHRNLPGRFLNWSPVAALGVLSYSLYLWQQPFLNRHSDAWINAFPQNIAIALLCALLSYFVVERSFLAWRNRLRSYNVSPKVSGETADAR